MIYNIIYNIYKLYIILNILIYLIIYKKVKVKKSNNLLHIYNKRVKSLEEQCAVSVFVIRHTTLFYNLQVQVPPGFHNLQYTITIYTYTILPSTVFQ